MLYLPPSRIFNLNSLSQNLTFNFTFFQGLIGNLNGNGCNNWKIQMMYNFNLAVSESCYG